MNLSLFLYDIVSNFLPGIILLYFIFLKKLDIFEWVVGIGDLKKEKVILIVFLIGAYLLGNIINFITRKICETKFFKGCLKNSFKDLESNDANSKKVCYEKCKNILRLKNEKLLKIQEEMELKYLLFRNVGFSLTCILFYEIYKYGICEKKLIILVSIIIICIIKFIKYWNLSGETLRSLYDSLSEK
ncbi:MAG: hypothetical protein ACRDDK_00210 [Cetobacterium sp.]